MQLILILFLLSLNDKSTDLNETLKKALAFYRENRELISMLANGSFPAAQQEPQSEQKAAENEQEKDRPQTVGQSNNAYRAVESFLSNYAI